MKRGYQWGALSARSHITAPEVGDHGDSCEFGEPAGVPYLQGIGCVALRVVAERLAVTADRCNGVAIQRRRGQQHLYRGRVLVCQMAV